MRALRFKTRTTLPSHDTEAGNVQPAPPPRHFAAVLQLGVYVISWYAASAFAVIFLKQALTRGDVAGAVLDATFAQMLCGWLGAEAYQCGSGGSGGGGRCGSNGGRRGNAAMLLHTKEAWHATGFYFRIAALCNVVGAAATNWAVVAGGASLSQVLKFAEPTVTRTARKCNF